MPEQSAAGRPASAASFNLLHQQLITAQARFDRQVSQLTRLNEVTNRYLSGRDRRPIAEFFAEAVVDVLDVAIGAVWILPPADRTARQLFASCGQPVPHAAWATAGIALAARLPANGTAIRLNPPLEDLLPGVSLLHAIACRCVGRDGQHTAVILASNTREVDSLFLPAVEELPGMLSVLAEKCAAHIDNSMDRRVIEAHLASLEASEAALVASDAQLRTALGDQEALLKEVHHRVKNNLQVINSLMRLEAGRADDAAVRTVLGDMRSRILSMALLHETLYRSENFAEIELSQYFSELAPLIFRTAKGREQQIELALHLSPALVTLDQSVPCGLILNELISNSIKHGFRDGRSGTTTVTLATGSDDRIALTVSDTGVGLPPTWETRSARSLGLQLVDDLTRQLHGTLSVDAPTSTFLLEFPAMKRAGRA